MNREILSSDLSVRERVFTICNQLHSENTKVKIRTVLSLLPDVKSTSTVHKYHKEWREELDKSKKTLFDAFGFSENFQNAFVTEIARFHTDANNQYSEKLIELTEDRDSAVASLEDADKAVVYHQTRADHLDDQVNELTTEISLLTREAKQHSEQQDKDKAYAVEKVVQQKDELESRLINEKRLVVEQLQQQIDSLTQKNNELREANENQRTELAKANLKLESNNDLVVEVKSQAAAVAAEAKKRIDMLELNYSTLSKEHIQCSQDLAVCKEKILSKDELVLNSLNQYEMAIQNESALRAMVEERDRDQRELRGKLERITHDDNTAQIELLRLTEKLGEYKHILNQRESRITDLLRELAKEQKTTKK